MARTYRLGHVRRAVNVLMTALLDVGIGSRSSYLLSTIGRRSGQVRTTPVVLLEEDGKRWLVSPYDAVGWVHNVRATPEITLRRGRRTEACHIEEVSPEIAGPVLRRYLGKARVTAPFFDVTTDDDVELFVAEAYRYPVFRLIPSRASTEG